ncbi:MAG: thiamine phosphate synthase [Planctomycetota bacterium]
MPRDALRILDANLNRAREGLRTAEEFARLSANDADRARALKNLRHNLDTLFRAPALHRALLAARDVAADVGAGLTLPSQTAARAADLTPADVARAAVKRALEALRNLEEYLPAAPPPAPAGSAAGSAKWPAPRALAALRYALYDLERDLFLTLRRRELLAGRVLCLLWSPEHYTLGAEQALHAAAAGARAARRPDALLIQLRVKQMDDGPLLKLARATRKICARLDLPLILNDRPLVALHAGCDGVHLGQTDLPPALARELLGPDKLIGLSTHSAEQIRAALREPVDYLGLGPMFASTTKPELKPQGSTLAQATRAVRRHGALPVFAIGGVSAANISTLVRHGLGAAAVSSAVFGSSEPKRIRAAVHDLLRALP